MFYEKLLFDLLGKFSIDLSKYEGLDRKLSNKSKIYFRQYRKNLQFIQEFPRLFRNT
jgi:hypothetical protein